jgi:hypothetical protein
MAEKIIEEKKGIPESAEPIAKETTDSVSAILKTPEEDKKIEKKEAIIDKDLFFTPLKPLID